MWQAAPWIAHRLGCANAYALEYANVSCGTPVALRLARDLLRAEPELRNVLLVAACRESYLLDYGERALALHVQLRRRRRRGAAYARRAARAARRARRHGRLVLAPGEGAGGRLGRARSAETVAARRHFLDVADPAQMKDGLDAVSLPNFVAAARGALERSGARLEDVSLLCGIHMKRSMHEAILRELGARAGGLPRRHRPHERRRPAARARSRRPGRRARGRRPRAAPRRRHRLHVGGYGAAMVIDGPRRAGARLAVARDRAGAREPLRRGHGRRAVDPRRPRAGGAGPFGTTIAHGFLTLSLVVPLFERGAAAARGLCAHRQLRLEPRALHGARAGREPDSRPLPRGRTSRRSRAACRRRSRRRSSARARRSPSAWRRRSSASSADP